MSNAICLNADLGELPGPDGRALDAAMLRVVTRCNIACGGHAGDVDTMRETVRQAKASGVQIGAHPSYPDREHFGRRSLEMNPSELAGSLLQQTRLLMDIAREEGAAVMHLKAHGALYNDAAKDPVLAAMVVGVAKRAGISRVVGPPNSATEAAARAVGLEFIAEGFADRSYEPNGALTPRSVDGAVITATPTVLAQALGLARDGNVTVRGGGKLALKVGTLCLHSDTPGAAAHAAAIRAGLEAAGVEVRA